MGGIRASAAPHWHTPQTLGLCAQQWLCHLVLRPRLGTSQVSCGSLDTILHLGADATVRNGDLATHSLGRL